MKSIFAGFAIICSAAAQQDARISYQTEQASVQYIVIDLAKQVGLDYNWDKSFAQTNPQCRQWVRNVQLEAMPFAAAMQKILDQAGPRYEVENGEVVLYRRDLSTLRINYFTDRKSVQYVVIDLARQVGLGYNREKSYTQTDPDCRRFVDNLSIKNETFEKAMAHVLNPVGLRYRVEDNQVVLFR